MDGHRAIDDMRLFPAWLGPAKVWVRGRGAAYAFGVFAVSPATISFATPDRVAFTAPREDVKISWAWWTGGIICHIHILKDSYGVAFGRPFPDAPSPDQRSVQAAVALLGAANSPSAGRDTGRPIIGGGVIGEFVQTARNVVDLTSGRKRAKTARALLADI